MVRTKGIKMSEIVSNCCGAKLLKIESSMCSNCKEHCDEEEFNGSNHYPHSNEKGYVYPLKKNYIKDKELSYLIRSLHPQFNNKGE
jgi:hypothetical protein